MLTLDELYRIKESLVEIEPDVVKLKLNFSYTFAEARRKEALRLLEREIKLVREFNEQSY